MTPLPLNIPSFKPTIPTTCNPSAVGTRFELLSQQLQQNREQCERTAFKQLHSRLIFPIENGTFQDNASKLFNTLPEAVRTCSNYGTFIKHSKEFLYEKASSWLLTLL